MKRLIFCFDGTWNKLLPDLATNVVLTAASVKRVDDSGIVQIMHYDEGVGTDSWTAWRGGMFGTGLIENVREAYRFLVFNYDPGDEIYVFGFSRGAYSARSFVGFLRHVGPLRRLHAGRIDAALSLYETRKKGPVGSGNVMRQFRADYSDTVCVDAADEAWRCANKPGYVTSSAPLLRVKYLGVWDTVGALGVPRFLPFSGWLNREYDFHDPSVDAFVERARHAVALDERRTLFPPVLFGDLTDLNSAVGFSNDDPKAPYQEKWFPGVHGSVGGGGDIRGLSDDALAWVLAGAKDAGLKLDTSVGTRIHTFRPDYLASLINEADPKWSASLILKTPRQGPDRLSQVSNCAQRRWRSDAERLGEAKYRPKSLQMVAEPLNALGPWEFTPPSDLLATEIVKVGDTLSAYAQRYYKDPSLWPRIHDANLDVIDDPDEIFAGQQVRIPRVALAEPAKARSKRKVASKKRSGSASR